MKRTISVKITSKDMIREKQSLAEEDARKAFADNYPNCKVTTDIFFDKGIAFEVENVSDTNENIKEILEKALQPHFNDIEVDIEISLMGDND